MFYFHVVCGKKHIDLVRADSEAHAIAIITARFGKSTTYSHTESYKAIKA